MTDSQASEWSLLKARLIAATSTAGAKTALAKKFGVSKPAVSQWLGDGSPNAETALRLNKWVEEAERSKKKTPGGATNTTRGHKTRSRKSSYEKPKPGPRKQ